MGGLNLMALSHAIDPDLAPRLHVDAYRHAGSGRCRRRGGLGLGLRVCCSALRRNIGRGSGVRTSLRLRRRRSAGCIGAAGVAALRRRGAGGRRLSLAGV